MSIDNFWLLSMVTFTSVKVLCNISSDYKCETKGGTKSKELPVKNGSKLKTNAIHNFIFFVYKAMRLELAPFCVAKHI